MTLRSIAKAILPPVIADTASRLLHPGNIWRGDYRSWAEASADSVGYHTPSILDRVEASALKVKRGEAEYERDGVLFDEIEYSWPVLSSLMWIAARNQGKLDVVDFGGSLGHTFFQNRKFLADLEQVRWSVVEQPSYVDRGKRSFEDDRLRFYENIDASLADQPPQVLLLSSVLQYLETPHQLLEDVAHRFEFLIIDLTPTHGESRDRLTVQQVPREIYEASYPCWLFSEERLLEGLRKRFNLVAAFDSHFGHGISAGRLRANYRGFVLALAR